MQKEIYQIQEPFPQNDEIEPYQAEQKQFEPRNQSRFSNDEDGIGYDWEDN
jgi:hypothetical protein